MVKMKLSEIKISLGYGKSQPKNDKLKSCRDYYAKNKEQDRYIVVNHSHTLIDGYIQYLVLKEAGVEEAEVQVSHKRNKKWHRKPDVAIDYKTTPTTYIYGRHYRVDNNSYSKEYVWRVPNTWVDFTDGLYVGDTIIVRTKYGNKPIEITGIEVLDKPPIDAPIRKVCKNNCLTKG